MLLCNNPIHSSNLNANDSSTSAIGMPDDFSSALGLLKRRALSQQQHANAKSRDQQQPTLTGDKRRKRKRGGGSSTPKSDGNNSKLDHSADQRQLCSSKDMQHVNTERLKRNNGEIDLRQPEVAWRPQQLYRRKQRGLAVRGWGLCEVPVEGKVDIGLKLGFNYWISGENCGRIMTTDVRDLVLFVLSKSENVATTTNQPCLPWVCEKSLNGCRRVVLACASALPMPYAESDFFDGKAPHLECWSRVPTEHNFHHTKQLLDSSELKASPAFLLWKERPSLPQNYLLSTTPTVLFVNHTIFFEAVRGGDQRRSPETIVLNGRSWANIPIEGKCGPILSRDEDGEVDEREEGPLVRLKLCEGQAFGLQSGSKAKWVLYEITGGCTTGNRTIGEWMKEEPGGSTTISCRLVLIVEWLSMWLPEELELVRRDGSELIFQGRGTRDTAREKKEAYTSAKNILGGQPPLTLTMTKALPENVLQKEVHDAPVAIQQPEIQFTTDIPQGGVEQEENTKDTATEMECPPRNTLLSADPSFQNLEEYSLSYSNRRRLNIPVSVEEEEEGYVNVKPIGVNNEGSSEDSEEGELTCDEVLLPPLRAPLPLVAIDCEMVYTKCGIELARVSIVDRCGKPLYDEFVKPSEPVLSYNTEFSGISEENLSGVTKSLEIVQKEIRQFVGPETYMVGHSIDSDLHALRLVYHHVIDTAHLYPHPKGYPYKRSLKNLCSTLLGKEVQEGTGTSGHDSLADAAHAMELALLKMARGPDYATPEPWANSFVPRETIFASLHRNPIIGKTTDRLPPLDCLVIGDKHGSISSEWPSGSSLWDRCARGYRKETDVIWVAEKYQEEKDNIEAAALLGTTINNEANNDGGHTVQSGQQREVVVKASAQPSAACMLQKAVEALEDEALAPDFTWIDLPCSPSTTIDKVSGSTINWGSIADVNSAASALYEASPKGTLLLLVCQDSLMDAIRMKEEKIKSRWAFKRSVEAQKVICATAGTKQSKPVQPSWDDEKEKKLKAAVKDARKGVTFLAVK